MEEICTTLSAMKALFEDMTIIKNRVILKNRGRKMPFINDIWRIRAKRNLITISKILVKQSELVR